MSNRLLKFFLICSLVVLLTGCAGAKNRASSDTEEEVVNEPGLAPSGKFRFADLPVPAGFKLLVDKSFAFENDAARVALLKYAGKAKVEELVRFYEEQMLLYNWQLLNVVEYGRSVLNFERGNQSCIITIEPASGKRIVTISLAPKGSKSTGSRAKDK